MRHATAPYDREVVVRRIDRPVDSLPVSAPTTFGALRLTAPFTIDPTALSTTWRAPGRVGWARVEVEVAAWSERSSEVRILPVSRHVHLWTARRRGRYFAWAHQAADALAALLVTTLLHPVSAAGDRGRIDPAPAGRRRATA